MDAHRVVYSTFSATNAHLLISSAVAVGIARLPWWETCVELELDAPCGCECADEAGRLTRLYAGSTAADAHELYAGPAPMGRV